MVGLFNLGYLIGLIGFYVLVGYGVYRLIKWVVKKVKSKGKEGVGE